MPAQNCESCMMPFSKNPGKRESDKYCSYCFKNGELVYKGTDVKEFQKKSYEVMRQHGTNPVMAWIFTWMIKFAPRWKK